jgi:hypothetical protein
MSAAQISWALGSQLCRKTPRLVLSPLFSTIVSAIFMAAKDLRIFQDCARKFGAKRLAVRRLDAVFVRGANGRCRGRAA